MPITSEQLRDCRGGPIWAELCRDNSIAELRFRMNTVRGDINALRAINTLARAVGRGMSVIKRKSEPAIRYRIEVK